MQQDKVLKRLRSNDSTLTTLHLDWNNGLGEGGGAAVAGALERNTTLTTLDLWNNGVRDETMERVRRLLSGREVPAGSGGAEAVGVKAAVAALPCGTKRGAPG